MFGKVVKITKLAALGSAVVLTGCGSSAFSGLNPFDSSHEGPELGKRDLSTLTGGTQSGESPEAKNARQALEVMGSYRSTQAPQPVYPVIQPAEVRLMWVPDHLTKSGDLVPAHYYYLKVLEDRWAVQDAFDLEQQLGSGSSQASTATPWVYGDPGKNK